MEPTGGGAGSNVATLLGFAKPIEMTALVKCEKTKITFARHTTSYKLRALNNLNK